MTPNNNHTRRISATIAQFRFRNNSPKNISTKQRVSLYLARIAPPNMSGVLTIKPKAQINGSALKLFVLRFVAARAPNGTPISPDSIVTTPKLNDTLHKKIAF